MKIEEFEKELQGINKDLSIRPNNAPKRVLEVYPDVDKLASILYCGVEVCTIPNHEIFDERNANYGIDLRQDGRFVAHRTRPEALERVQQKLGELQDKEFSDQFFGRGEYSEAALRRKDEPVLELVEEVPIQPEEIQGGMIEGAK